MADLPMSHPESNRRHPAFLLDFGPLLLPGGPDRDRVGVVGREHGGQEKGTQDNPRKH